MKSFVYNYLADLSRQRSGADRIDRKNGLAFDHSSMVRCPKAVSARSIAGPPKAAQRVSRDQVYLGFEKDVADEGRLSGSVKSSILNPAKIPLGSRPIRGHSFC